MSRKKFFIPLLLLCLTFLTVGCNKDSVQNEVFEVEYFYNFEMPGGILAVNSHVFEFLNKPTQVGELLNGNSLQNVKSVKLKTAELINYENDGGLKVIRKMECFIYPSREENEYYDLAYTVELPRKSRDFIQFFSSGDEFKKLYEHDKMDVRLRIWLWQIPQRSRNLQFRFTLGFYN